MSGSTTLELSWAIQWHHPVAGYTDAHSPELPAALAAAARDSVRLPLDIRVGDGWESFWIVGDSAVAVRYGVTPGTPHDQRPSQTVQLLILSLLDQSISATAGQLAAAMLPALDLAPSGSGDLGRGPVRVIVPTISEIVGAATEEAVDAAAGLAGGKSAECGVGIAADAAAALSLLPDYLARTVLVRTATAPKPSDRPVLTIAPSPASQGKRSADTDRFLNTVTDLRQAGKSLVDIAVHLANYSSRNRPSVADEAADLLAGREVTREVERWRAGNGDESTRRAWLEHIVARAVWVVRQGRDDDLPYISGLERFLIANYVDPSARELVDERWPSLQHSAAAVLRESLKIGLVPAWIGELPSSRFEALADCVLDHEDLSLPPGTAGWLYWKLAQRSPARAGALLTRLSEDEQEQVVLDSVTGGHVRSIWAVLETTAETAVSSLTGFHLDLLDLFMLSSQEGRRGEFRMRSKTLVTLAAAARAAGLDWVRTPVDPDYVTELVRAVSSVDPNTQRSSRLAIDELGAEALPVVLEQLRAGVLAAAEVAAVLDLPSLVGSGADLADAVLFVDSSLPVVARVVRSVPAAELEAGALKARIAGDSVLAFSIVQVATDRTWSVSQTRRAGVVFAALRAASRQPWTSYARMVVPTMSSPQPRRLDLSAALEDLRATAKASSANAEAFLVDLLALFDDVPRAVFTADPAPVTVLFSELLKPARSSLRERLVTQAGYVPISPQAQACLDALGHWRRLHEPSRTREHTSYVPAAAALVDAHLSVLADLARTATGWIVPLRAGAPKADADGSERPAITRALNVLLATSSDAAGRELAGLVGDYWEVVGALGRGLDDVLRRMSAMSPSARPQWVVPMTQLAKEAGGAAAVLDALFHGAATSLVIEAAEMTLRGLPAGNRVALLATLAAQPRDPRVRQVMAALGRPTSAWNVTYCEGFTAAVRQTVEVLMSLPEPVRRRHRLWRWVRSVARHTPLLSRLGDGQRKRGRWRYRRLSREMAVPIGTAGSSRSSRSARAGLWLVPLLSVVAFVVADMNSSTVVRASALCLGAVFALASVWRVALAARSLHSRRWPKGSGTPDPWTETAAPTQPSVRQQYLHKQ